MAPGVRWLKGKTVVKVAALEMFLEEFCPDQMVQGLIEMCELAATHPDFGHRQVDDAAMYDWADQATDVLMTFLLDAHCCDHGSEDAPPFQVNSREGAIEILKPRIRRRRPEPSLARTSRKVTPRLLQLPHGRN